MKNIDQSPYRKYSIAIEMIFGLLLLVNGSVLVFNYFSNHLFDRENIGKLLQISYLQFSEQGLHFLWEYISIALTNPLVIVVLLSLGYTILRSTDLAKLPSKSDSYEEKITLHE